MPSPRRRPGAKGGGLRGGRHRPERRDPLERRNPLPGGNESFTCRSCGARVQPLRTGPRNHCPECLWSLHVDRVPGDRADPCGGMMQPVALDGSAARGWTIVFRCTACGAMRRNRAATDDPKQPDSWERLVALSEQSGGPGPAEDRRRRR